MKRGKVFLGIVAVAALCICSVLPVSAYKFTVESELPSTDGDVKVKVSWAQNWMSYTIYPGGTRDINNADWQHAGLCWTSIAVKPLLIWSGCPAHDWKETTLNLCRDVKVVLKRSGCDVDVQVQ